LVAQWEEQAKKPVKPKGSPMAALEDYAAAMQARALEQAAQEQALLTSQGTESQEVRLIEHEAREADADDACDEILEAAQ